MIMDKELKHDDIDMSGLDATDHSIMKLQISNPKITGKEIGNHVGVSEVTVNRRVNRPVYVKTIKEILKRQTMSAIERYTSDMTQAVEELRRLLKSDDEKIRLGAVKTYIQGMIVHKHLIMGDKDKPIEINQELNLSEQDRDLLKNTMKDYYKKRGQSIDYTGNETE